jgi:two-component system, OmpR family, sensor histidine kinase BaeS
MAVLRSTSLRAQLSLTYAGIALLTALLLGGILLSVLSGYYARAETAYLQAAAAQIQDRPLPRGGDTSLATWAARAALVEQVRVRVFDGAGELLADSGSPRDIGLGELDVRPDGRGDGRRGRRPQPLGEGIFGGSPSASASGASFKIGLTDASGEPAGYLVLSEPPTSGRAVLVGIAQAWTVAALFAVALAALAGYLLSSRISKPIVALTAASDRMADGDLSARAPVERADEVGRLGESFNQMADRMEGTVVALRRFVGDAAHEIGTPLTALRADLELAEGAASTDDERRLIGRALTQADRLQSLSESLLSLSRIEAGDPNGTIERVDLAATVSEAAESVASRAEQAGLTLEIDVAPSVLTVMADKGRLQTVFESLLDNAVKFTPDGGTVTVTARTDDGWATATVADTGIGIPDAEHGDVFSRFHRARNVSAYQGSGLGLAIVLATVERYNGTVAFESSDVGTRFEIRLPLV